MAIYTCTYCPPWYIQYILSAMIYTCTYCPPWYIHVRIVRHDIYMYVLSAMIYTCTYCPPWYIHVRIVRHDIYMYVLWLCGRNGNWYWNIHSFYRWFCAALKSPLSRHTSPSQQTVCFITLGQTHAINYWFIRQFRNLLIFMFKK